MVTASALSSLPDPAGNPALIRLLQDPELVLPGERHPLVQDVQGPDIAKGIRVVIRWYSLARMVDH